MNNVITIRLTDPEFEILKRNAKYNNRSMNNYVVNLILNDDVSNNYNIELSKLVMVVNKYINREVLVSTLIEEIEEIENCHILNDLNQIIKDSELKIQLSILKCSKLKIFHVNILLDDFKIYTNNNVITDAKVLIQKIDIL